MNDGLYGTSTLINITDTLNALYNGPSTYFKRSCFGYGSGAWVSYNTTSVPSIAFANIQYPLADLIIMALAGPSEEVVAFEILLQYCVKTYKTTLVSDTATTVVVGIETAESLGIKPVPSAIQCPPEIEAYGLCWDTPNEFNLTLPISTSSSTVNYSCPFETVFALHSFLASTLL
jgi:hypothetical protein